MRHGGQSVCGLVFNLADTTQGLERKERDDLSRGLAAGRLLRRLNRRDPVKQMKRGNLHRKCPRPFRFPHSSSLEGHDRDA